MEIKRIDGNCLSRRAQEFFGGDVQSFEIWQRAYGRFELRQTPYFGNVRVAAVSYETTIRAAIADFNGMAVSGLFEGFQYA